MNNPIIIKNPLETYTILSFIESFILVFLCEFTMTSFFLLFTYRFIYNKTVVLVTALVSIPMMGSMSVMTGYFMQYFTSQFYIDIIAVFILICASIYLMYQGFTREYKSIADDMQSKIKEIPKPITCNLDDTNALKEPLIDSTNQLKTVDNEIRITPSPAKKRNTKKGYDINNADDRVIMEDLAIANDSWINFGGIMMILLENEFANGAQFSLFAISSVLNIFGVLIGASCGMVLAIILVLYTRFEYVNMKMINLFGGISLLLVAIEISYAFGYQYFWNGITA